MNIIINILINIIILYIRTRVLDQAFSQKKIKTSITIKTLLNGLFLVGTLFLYQYFLKNIKNGIFYFGNLYSIINIGIFIIFCLIISIIIILIYKNQKNIYIRKIVLTGTILFILLTSINFYIKTNIIISYLLITTYAEEILKFTTGNNSIKNKENQLLFFCILTGLGFSIIENIFYSSIFFKTNIFGNINISIIRGLTSTLIHVLSTGIIGYIIIRIKSQKKIKLNIFFTLILAILAGFFIHLIYNISLEYGNKITILITIIISYFLLTFLIFQTDQIFLKQK